MAGVSNRPQRGQTWFDYFVNFGCMIGTLVLSVFFVWGVISLADRVMNPSAPIERAAAPGGVTIAPTVPLSVPPTLTLTPTVTATLSAPPTPTPTTAPTAPTIPLATLGGGNGWLTYSSDLQGDFDIYAMRLDGSEVQQLTTASEDDFRPI